MGGLLQLQLHLSLPNLLAQSGQLCRGLLRFLLKVAILEGCLNFDPGFEGRITHLNCYIEQQYMWKVVILVVLVVLVFSVEEKLEYTQDLQKYKADKHNQRLELLVGCWLMAREHHPKANDLEVLALVKPCLRHITRKDSVVKITSLIGKNMTETKDYSQIVPSGETPDLMKLPVPSQFDEHLLTLLKNYEKDLSSVKGSEGEEIRRKIDDEMQKRQKYYLGFIPANTFSHMMMLISFSIVMVTCCTCWKYYNMRRMQAKLKVKEKVGYFKNSTKFTKNNPNINNLKQAANLKKNA